GVAFSPWTYRPRFLALYLSSWLRHSDGFCHRFAGTGQGYRAVDTRHREVTLFCIVLVCCLRQLRRFASRVPSLFRHLDYLSPFDMCEAFPRSDYYGDSVTLGLASLRRSRGSIVCTC